MRIIKISLITILMAIPFNVFAGVGTTNVVQFVNTDISGPQFGATRLSAYYDLRNRQSFVQVTNTSTDSVTIHVQIFQHDRGCVELDFDDTLTGNDTVVYDLDNIIKNNGTAAPINLQDDSYGYVVISDRQLDVSLTSPIPSLIGNFRIIDDTNYEYRTNMLGVSGINPILTNLDEITLQAFFNTVDSAMYADVVGYVYTHSTISNAATVDNFDPGIDFDIFTFDMSEEPLSCDRRNFACGNVMNYGVNEDYMNSRGGPLLCPGGGLANPDGGYVNFENGALAVGVDLGTTRPVFNYLVGLNNNNGTGSMDTWIDPTELPEIACSVDRQDARPLCCATPIREGLSQVAIDLCCYTTIQGLNFVSEIICDI